jgi:hypothetical protein
MTAPPVPVSAVMTTGVAPPAHHPIGTLVGLAREAEAAGPRPAWSGQTFSYDSPALAATVGRGGAWALLGEPAAS